MKRDKARLLISDNKGKIYDFPSLEACGMKGGHFFKLSTDELIKLPYGSEIFMLPERKAVGYDSKKRKIMVLDKYFAVSAFVSPGYTITYNSAYEEQKNPKILPLFAYGALAFYKGAFYAAALRVDRERRHDLRLMDMKSVIKNAKKINKLYPKNRLMKHLETCALTYGCPTAKNFFLGKYEAPLPASPSCNSACIGCISSQPYKKLSVTQPRIKFVPSAYEIAEVAIHHIKTARDPIVSFGQGCEGEPLLAGNVIIEAVKIIRRHGNKGMINMNTNASRPDIIEKLFDIGLDSIRVSFNSAKAEYYNRYYRPKGYAFNYVLDSIRIAKKKRGFVSINYLTMPGFTDLEYEFGALNKLIKKFKIDMIQWRNLNYDPSAYFRQLQISPEVNKMLGIKQIIYELKKRFPRLMHGYFNPSRKRILINSNI